MPVVIYIHGGGWMSGDRRENRNGVLAPHGFFTISIDYRLSHQAIFPAQIEDAKTAVRWVRAHAAQYHLDPTRIGVWGHSAGAHLAALLGTSAGVAELEGAGEWAGYSSRVQAVATLAAPTDFLRMGGWHDDPDSPEARLVGGPIHERVDRVRMANPLTYVRSDAPPFLLLHGDDDTIVPIGQSVLLHQALRAAGCDATFVPLAGASHDFDADEPSWHEARHMVLAFFKRHLCGNE
jgi:acetyl esterase/lipase